MSVRKNKQFDQLYELKSRFFRETVQKTLEFTVDELIERSLNVSVFSLCLPVVVKRLVLGLKVKSHLSEAGSSEVEIKVLVVLITLLRLFLKRIDD